MLIILSHAAESSPTKCESERSENDTIRCDAGGLYLLLQCNRLVNSTALNCYCAHPLTGAMLPNTMRRITNRNELLIDCSSHGKSPLNVILTFIAITIIQSH